MILDIQIGDKVTVADPGDNFAQWNNEFQGTVRRMKQGNTIVVECDEGGEIEVLHSDIIKRH